jgi:hypothetical protein
MPHPDASSDPAPALSAVAAALGRAARQERQQLDTLLARVTAVAADLARPAGRGGALQPGYAPERDPTLLHLWRAASRAYYEAPPGGG